MISALRCTGPAIPFPPWAGFLVAGARKGCAHRQRAWIARCALSTRAIGRGLVTGMPLLLKALSVIGTAAMLWVGGGIILHGLAGYGLAGPEHAIEAIAKSVGA